MTAIHFEVILYTLIHYSIQLIVIANTGVSDNHLFIKVL